MLPPGANLTCLCKHMTVDAPDWLWTLRTMLVVVFVWILAMLMLRHGRMR